MVNSLFEHKEDANVMNLGPNPQIEHDNFHKLNSVQDAHQERFELLEARIDSTTNAVDQIEATSKEHQSLLEHKGLPPYGDEDGKSVAKQVNKNVGPHWGEFVQQHINEQGHDIIELEKNTNALKKKFDNNSELHIAIDKINTNFNALANRTAILAKAVGKIATKMGATDANNENLKHIDLELSYIEQLAIGIATETSDGIIARTGDKIEEEVVPVMNPVYYEAGMKINNIEPIRADIMVEDEEYLMDEI